MYYTLAFVSLAISDSLVLLWNDRLLKADSRTGLLLAEVCIGKVAISLSTPPNLISAAILWGLSDTVDAVDVRLPHTDNVHTPKNRPHAK